MTHDEVGKTKAPITSKPMKYGTATHEPQAPPRALARDLLHLASVIMPLQLSPVRHWKRRSIDEPSEWKLRCSSIESPSASQVKRLRPRTA